MILRGAVLATALVLISPSVAANAGPAPFATGCTYVGFGSWRFSVSGVPGGTATIIYRDGSSNTLATSAAAPWYRDTNGITVFTGTVVTATAYAKTGSVKKVALSATCPSP